MTGTLLVRDAGTGQLQQPWAKRTRADPRDGADCVARGGGLDTQRNSRTVAARGTRRPASYTGLTGAIAETANLLFAALLRVRRLLG
jgi:hypothetical protein